MNPEITAALHEWHTLTGKYSGKQLFDTIDRMRSFPFFHGLRVDRELRQQFMNALRVRVVGQWAGVLKMANNPRGNGRR